MDGELVDIGQVGEIDTVEPGSGAARCSPTAGSRCVSSVARGDDGEVYNVNADTAAAALAVALGAAKLIVLTDVAGPVRGLAGHAAARRRSPRAGAEVISQLTATELERLLPGLSAGMIPKMEACLRAVRGGVPQAHVLDGRLPHSVLLEIFTDSGIGTMVVPDESEDAVDERRRDATGRPRFEAALMNNYGTAAAGPGPRRGLPWSGTPTAGSTLDLHRRHRGQLARPRPPGDRRGGHRAGAADSRTPRTCSCTRARSRSPNGCSPCSARDGRVFFANSGTEANEAAFKLVRRHQGPARPVIVAAEGGFHGRTMGALALTGKESITASRSAPSGLTFGLFPTATPARWRRRSGADCAAVFLEPVLGRGRAWCRPRPGYLRAARAGLRRGRGAAGARRDPERHRAHRRLVRPPGRRDRPRRAHAGQGAGRRAADRRLHRARRGGAGAAQG